MPLEPAAVRALVERAGLDIVRLRAGLERVALYAMGQPTITADDVRQSVPAGPEAQADFGIAKAIWRNDAREALRELAAALDAGAAPFCCWGSCGPRPSGCRRPRLRRRDGRRCSGPTSRSSRRAAIRRCCWSGWWWSCAR